MKKILVLILAAFVISLFGGLAYADLNDGLVAFWPFNGNANDASGNGNDGVVFGATLCEDRFGNEDSAYCFDGVDDYINIGNNVKPPFPITVSTWIKVNEPHIGHYFTNDYVNHAGNRYGLLLAVGDDDLLRSHVFEGFSAPWNRVSKASNDPLITYGEWHHFLTIFNAHNNMQHFWDGAEVDGYYYGTGSSMQYSNGDGWIGKVTGTSQPSWPFNGAIDDIRVYNRALSSSEISDLFSNNCGFADVPPGFWAEDYICAIYNAGITTGCAKNPLRYCLFDPVNRAQMAAFIVRAVEGEPPDNYCDSGSPFPDVPPTHPMCKYIKRLFELGITTGYNDGTYRPTNLINRAQMAAFIVRAVEGEPPANYCDSGSPFADISANSPMCKYIKRLFELGITTGCAQNPLRYCPHDPVNRAQMAAFLARAFLGMN